MEPTKKALFESKMDATSLQKLAAINNDQVDEFVAYAIELCEPDSVFVGDDSDMDASYCRMRAIDGQEESQLATNGHTVHFDGYFDQARKKDVTKYLVPADETLDPNLNQVEREEGLAEIEGMQRGAYKGRLMYVRFFCLGATDSAFAIPCLQITDSAYVVHSEELLYRRGYEEFKRQSAADPNFEFFRYRHATGEVDERMTSKNYEDNRVYMDHTRNTVLSVNTQYAGNTVGLKKLSLRLAIRKADREGWLAEHMFIMRCNGPKGRETYLAGAYPSACGKTATAMLPGENIVGDDLAYFKVIDGEFRACNVEAGIFGIITDVNADDDPVIWDVLHRPGEVVFGNLCVKDGKPYWLGMSEETPVAGANYASDEWTEGMVGPDGNVTTLSHKNARYTVQMRDLENADPDWDNKQGLPIGGIIYGGRDSDTSVPVREAYSWDHGVCMMGATLESETTSATIGQEGVRKWNVMSNMDFLSMSVGRYIQNNLDFAKDIKRPKVFGTNYFLKKDGKFLNGKLDKGVWIKWMDLRINGEVDVLDAGYGLIPKYEDLRKLFKEVRDEDYTMEQYVQQFTVNLPEVIAKIGRMEEIYTTKVQDTPEAMKAEMKAERERLEALRAAKGDYISPCDL
ncbi:MAG: phosphoenolpyruvate carboxykinase (GTP) [Lentisphaerae bacterium]|jgi:phosphoenolpyruvate carboxykinase (GTP)|nr:phosphoenolpyruvate carboxykinase (GTP) [Lentisphaerota bacterium]MBT4815223.1 phosphoenolpyruvate carboxykinase (GTP) [Lentisphaerota bacterium]MBT5606108.1 phosphoenolpyruvate carboxykinase (GTP) [Lentisphaerota bacterium]MBT7058556.1 phosphoenolpyruvate carboxykinase (GTP) [Lentisphaerota bacterium]MBT7845790.1 phosphoenolpyruvate carboxykinase (GTP) [Lentisphaerota bacterium]